MLEPAVIRQSILDIIAADTHLSDDVFNRSALACFEFQFTHSAPYRKYCERRLRTPANVTSWLDVPAVPTAAFKESALVAGAPQSAQAIFRTSGTTQGSEKRGAHYVLDLELYRASLLRTFARYVLPDTSRMPMVSLVPQWQPGGASSLSFMVTAVMEELGAENSIYGINAAGLDSKLLIERLSEFSEPVCVLGTSLAFVHWFDELRKSDQSWQLPAGSRIMDTGGFKGSARTVSNAELRLQYQALLGVPANYVINEYGMTEMLSQFYDTQLAEPDLRTMKAGPPWVRTAVVDPETLVPLPAGEAGLLRHFDLANVFSVSAIQTEDVGRMVGAGFELHGRAAGAAPRGCSIAMDMFLSAART